MSEARLYGSRAEMSSEPAKSVEQLHEAADAESIAVVACCSTTVRTVAGRLGNCPALACSHRNW